MSSGGSESGALLKPSGQFETFTIPSKATKDTDWSSQLRTYILDAGEDPASYQAEITALNKLRQDLRGASGSSVGIDIAVHYYRQLDSLSKRLPLAENPMVMNFVWYDAFDRDCSAKQSSIAFEKANVLFNLGAVFSQFANLKDAPKNFQSAASVFTYIADNFLHPPLMDINRANLLFSSALMLAQAQEAVVLHAWSENKSLATLGRLAASAAKYANEARRLLSVPEMANMRSCLLSDNFYCDRDPLTLVQLKATAWDVIAEYLRAEAAYKETLVGEAISRIKCSQSILDEVLETSTYDTASKLMTYLHDLQAHLKLRIPAMEKENSLIYTQSIPDYKSLSLIEGVSLVKLMPLADVQKCALERPDLFKRLLPLRVHEEMSKYSEEKAKLLRYESLKVTTADSELQSTLTSFGFPAALESLERIQDGKVLSEDIVSLRKKAASIDVDGLKQEAGNRSKAISSLLDDINELLDQEIAAYQRGRVEHGASWTLQPSHVHNTELFEQLAELQDNLRTIMSRLSSSISTIVTETIRTDFSLLTGPEALLINLLPRPDNLLDDERIEFVKDLRATLDELERLRRTRSAGLDSLRDSLLADDISDILAVTKIADLTSLFHQELGKFDESCRSIEDNIKSHTTTLAKFKGVWAEISAFGKSKESDALRSELLQRFSSAVTSYGFLAKDMHTFCTELDQLKRQCELLQQKVNVFSLDRAREREHVERTLQIADAQKGQEYLLQKLQKLSTKSNNNNNNSNNNNSKTTESQKNASLKTFVNPSSTQVEPKTAPNNEKASSTRSPYEPSLLD